MKVKIQNTLIFPTVEELEQLPKIESVRVHLEESRALL